ncbi:hypothetical protein VTN02DRAFT_2610 [Thermoascus thermophilus]
MDVCGQSVSGAAILITCPRVTDITLLLERQYLLGQPDRYPVPRRRRAQGQMQVLCTQYAAAGHGPWLGRGCATPPTTSARRTQTTLTVDGRRKDLYCILLFSPPPSSVWLASSLPTAAACLPGICDRGVKVSRYQAAHDESRGLPGGAVPGKAHVCFVRHLNQRALSVHCPRAPFLSLHPRLLCL